ncbi:hypothetical protein L0668_12935 [Paraglaciecola aquimarina]|uniref:Solute-binding protein family 3/N-terminal domain-containing protein n=1 Tax=Paraglaciecola algarum TaxID=3050085 RepID=A0ABS9D9G7_9ALTE|nr:hypothetical protein [Paraglaciecola sp. G1-23]MCF2949020.1 hypothetical protein [Paraglaciecola sp. G1-23]
MKLISHVLMIIIAITSIPLFAIGQIKHISSEAQDNQKSYFVDMLALALQKSESKYGQFQLKAVDASMGEQRQLKSVNDGTLDVIWTMTSIEREKQALPIRIPLLKGLLGYRVFVIRKEQQHIFANITDTSELKKLTAVQGFGWPDYDILKANDFTVVDSQWYSTIYKSLSRGFYDYFPRSIIEVWSEMDFYDASLLTVDQKHLVIYPTAIYFFVGLNQTQLAKQIENGLLLAIKDGSFQRLLTNYPTHKQTFNSDNIKSRIKHFLHNPLLPEKTPIQNPDLWFEPIPEELH